MAESAQALGAPPIALAEAAAFARVAPRPLPAADFGLRGAPNLEALALTAPDLILSSSYYTFIEPRLAEIAPVFSRPLYGGLVPPFQAVTDLLPDLGAVLGLTAAPALAEAEAAFTALSARLRGFDREVLVIELGDSRHIRSFGPDSLYGGTLTRLGLRNGWSQPSAFAFAAPLPLAALATLPEAHLVLHGAPPPQVDLESSALWASLAPVRAGRVSVLPERNAFGGLPTALAFAHDLAEALA